MLQGFLIYLALAIGTSAVVLVLRIIAMLRPPRTGKKSPGTLPPEARPTPEPGRRQVASGWPVGSEGAARLR